MDGLTILAPVEGNAVATARRVVPVCTPIKPGEASRAGVARTTAGGFVGSDVTVPA